MRGGRRPILIEVLAAFIMALAAASTALAMGEDFSRAPQPITASELTRYGDMLLLSEEQRFAVEGLFESYLDEFAPVRAEIIELAVEHPRTRLFSGDDPFTKRLPGFLARLRDLDHRFFRDAEPLLTGEQQAMLPRIRLLRERLIYADLDVVGRFIGHAIPDISVLLQDMKPPQETMNELQPALLAYEERLTLGMRAIIDAAVRLCGAGGGGGRGGGGDDAAAEALIERVRSLRAFNRRSHDEIAAMLNRPVARRLEREFFNRAYGSAYDAPRSHLLPRLEAALERDDIDEPEREALRRLLNDRKAHYERTLRELIEIAEEEFIYRSPPGGAVPRGEDPYHRINEARRESSERDFESRRTLRELLGEDRAKAILSAPLDDGDRMVRAMGGLSASCGVTSTAPRIRQPWPAAARRPMHRSDPLLAYPIELTALDDFALLLELQGEPRRALVDAHRLYSEQLEEQLEPLRREWATINFGRMNESHEERAERFAKMPDLRLRFRNIVMQADERFFDDLREVVGLGPDDQRLGRARRLRQRALYEIATFPQPDNPNRAGEADAVLTLVRARLESDEWEVIEDIVDDYERRVYALLRQRHESVSGADVRASRGGGFITQEEMNERTRRGELPHAHHRDLVALVQETIDTIVEALAPESARRVLDVFHRQAYPLAYDDPMSMEQAIAQAASLHDLTGDQRQSIAEMRSDYTAAYEEVRSGIIEASADLVPDLRIAYISITTPEEKARAQQRFAQTYDKLTNERAAINRRALRGLRTALTPAQLRRLDLPQVE